MPTAIRAALLTTALLLAAAPLHATAQVWFDADWMWRTPVELTEPGVSARSDEYVDAVIDFGAGPYTDLTAEVRVADAAGTEIPSLVHSISGDTAHVLFPFDVTQGGSETVYVYWSNANASAPSYTFPEIQSGFYTDLGNAHQADESARDGFQAMSVFGAIGVTMDWVDADGVTYSQSQAYGYRFAGVSALCVVHDDLAASTIYQDVAVWGFTPGNCLEQYFFGLADGGSVGTVLVPPTTSYVTQDYSPNQAMSFSCAEAIAPDAGAINELYSTDSSSSCHTRWEPGHTLPNGQTLSYRSYFSGQSAAWNADNTQVYQRSLELILQDNRVTVSVGVAELGCDDLDGDGYGDVACGGSDCDDGDAAINPGATELCNGIDDDCDGTVDGANAADAITWYLDDDGDDHGQTAAPLADCDQPAGYGPYPDDCDDTDATVYPGAPELFDGIDNDCDGLVDDGAVPFGAIVITEIMKNPDEVDDDDGEWFELYNNSVHDVNLLTLEVADLDGDGFVVDVDLWVAPGEYAVFGRVADMGLNGGVAVDFEYTGFTLANNGDDEIVLTFGGVELDRVVFGDAPWPDTTGAAASLGWPGYDATGNDDPDSWCDAEDIYGLGDLGTPGDHNPSCCWDLDGDGANDVACGGDDCDDTDADVFPGANEVCNAVDDDCDGNIDDGAIDAIVWYIDVDGDGFGNAQVSMTACDQPAGFVLAATDCDDNAALVNPDAEESCNFVDDDCNGLVDDDAADAGTWYDDDDGDGYGDDGTPVEACDAPPGTVGVGGDCDDAAPAINPGVDEQCNGLDDDCDGTTDEPDAVDAQTWYLDDDGDGFGDASDSTVACAPPAGHVGNPADCDDDRADVYPGADELCDGVDNNCDGTVDGPNSIDAQTWYLDADGDGFGDPASTTTDCAPPPAYVGNAADCDDGDASVHPGADEICNGVDDDCDPATNEQLDADGDGFAICDGDCDDDEPDAWPGNEEVCDGVDNDCDPATDELADSDGDGWTICAGDCDDDDGDVHPTHAEDCDGLDNDCDGNLLPDEVDDDGDGWLRCGGDCDDTNPLTYDGAPEQCDGLDNDCDGDVDEDTGVDLDGDGYNACQGDCNDQDPAIGPQATEVCDGTDTDCDGTTPADEVDDDGDGWLLCDGDCDDDDDTLNLDDADADGWTTCDGDCDDDAGGVFPGATEIAYDGVDQDCDGADLTDVDGDGYDGGVGDDCDDENADIHPDADEICDDGVDNDCDGDADADDEDCATGDDDDTTGDDDDTTGDDDIPGDDDDDDVVEPDDCSCRTGDDAAGRAGGAPARALAALALVGVLALRRRRG